jgi:hypothetical protein
MLVLVVEWGKQNILNPYLEKFNYRTLKQLFIESSFVSSPRTLTETNAELVAHEKSWFEFDFNPYLRFQVLTTATMNILAIWDVTQYSVWHYKQCTYTSVWVLVRVVYCDCGFSNTVVFNMRYAKKSYINQNETQESLKPCTSSDPRTHKDSSQNWGAGMPETGSVISLTG